MAGKGVVLVFDFDKTIIDCDSDNWVVDQMGLTHFFELLQPIMPWNSLMDRMMSELHSQGRTVEEIANCLKNIPLDSHIMTAIKAAHSLGCELRVVSDANSFFVETVLKHNGLFDCFSEINTNPCSIDEEGKLRIFPYHDFISSPHGCTSCPPNMCKGMIIERIQASFPVEPKKWFIYLGDGRGDFCPSLRLGEQDHVLPRKNLPLWDLICGNAMLIKAKVHEWTNGEELERILLKLINKVSVEDTTDPTTQLISVDCNFQTIPIPSHEPLPIPH